VERWRQGTELVDLGVAAGNRIRPLGCQKPARPSGAASTQQADRQQTGAAAQCLDPQLRPLTASTRCTSGEDISSSCRASAALLTCSALPASSSLTATWLSCQRPRNTWRAGGQGGSGSGWEGAGLLCWDVCLPVY